MQSKKIIFLLFFLGLFPFSCGKKILDHYEIQNITVTPYRDEKLSQPITQTDSLTSDSVHFKTNFQGQFIAMNQISLDLSNQLFAFTKRRDGDKGLKDKISNILIRSDKLYNGRSPGSSLNDLFFYKDYKSYNLQDAMNEFNGDPGYAFEDMSHKFVITQKPTDSLKHQFSFVFTFESGKIITANSTPIIWK